MKLRETLKKSPIPSLKIGINALFLKNPLTGVAKRVLSLYSYIPNHLPAKITFFSPYPLSESTLKCLESYGINFSLPQYHVVITPLWGLNFPVIREISEWWWLHFQLPYHLHHERIRLYEAPWGRGIPYLFPYRLKKWLKIEKPVMILTVHDLIPLYPSLPFEGSLTWGRELYRRFQSLSYDRRMTKEIETADRVIVISPQVREDIHRFFPHVNLSKITIFPNGISSSSLSLASGLRRKKNCWDYIQKHAVPNLAGNFIPLVDSRKFFFYIGGFSPRKNLLRFLKALSHIFSGGDNIPYALVLAGHENRYFKNKLLPFIERHPLPIFRLGYLSEQELLHFYREADWVCYPSLVEGFGMPPLEALAGGGRVIVDQDLPLLKKFDDGREKGRKKNFLVQILQQAFPDQKVETWWQEQVKVIDGRDVDQIASTLKRLVTGKSKRKPSPRGLWIWGKRCPLTWENLSREYARLIKENIKKNI